MKTREGFPRHEKVALAIRIAESNRLIRMIRQVQAREWPTRFFERIEAINPQRRS
jgi:hypothetical protein